MDATRNEKITGEIKALALKVGGDVVGVAPVERWDEFVPEGYRPYDIQPGAKSVVVVGTSGPTMGEWSFHDARLGEGRSTWNWTLPASVRTNDTVVVGGL